MKSLINRWSKSAIFRELATTILALAMVMIDLILFIIAALIDLPVAILIILVICVIVHTAGAGLLNPN